MMTDSMNDGKRKLIQKFLVTTDFSDYSLAGLEHALSMAAQFRADIHLLHVAEKGRGKSRQAVEALARCEMQKFITENTDEYTCIRQIILQGDPADEITRYARSNAIDMIVIATHGRTGLKHIVMGSIAEKVVRFSTVPVLTVKPTLVCERILSETDIAHDLHIHSS